MEKEKTENKKIEENDLENVAGGYTPHTYYTGTEDNPMLTGYITVNEEEEKLLKENGFINPYGGIDAKYADLARNFLRDKGHPRDTETDDKEYHRDLIVQ